MSWGKFCCTKEGFSKIKLLLRPLIYIFILSPPGYKRKICCQYTSTINVTYILLFCYNPCRKKSYMVVIRVFFHKHSRFVGQQGIGGGGGRGGLVGGISLPSPCKFHPLHRHLYISRVITAESSSLLIAYSWARNENL